MGLGLVVKVTLVKVYNRNINVLLLFFFQGLSPMDACQTVLEDILQRVGKENMFELGIIAVNMKVQLIVLSHILEHFPLQSYCTIVP